MRGASPSPWAEALPSALTRGQGQGQAVVLLLHRTCFTALIVLRRRCRGGTDSSRLMDIVKSVVKTVH